MNDFKLPSRFKFRAWDEYNEIMYYSDKEYEDCYFGFDKGVIVAWLRKIVPQTLDEPAHDVGEPIKNVMQFTNRHDKNGKEVYEKDVMKWIANYGTEEYPDEREMFEEVKFEGGAYQTLASMPESEFEVIGSVCENPDLLKEIK